LPIGEDTNFLASLAALLEGQQKSNREPLPLRETAVLQTLFIGIHAASSVGTFALRYLTEMTNSFLKEACERFRVSPRGVGAALTSLGFAEHWRTNTGWVVLLDRKAQKKIHEWMAAYGVDNFLYKPTTEAMERCDLCKQIKGSEVQR
jgi:hypothetical protein